MKKWDLNFPDRKIISDLTLSCGVTTLTAAVLASRGYTSSDEVFAGLQVEQLSDPFLINDMEAAADIINNAIDSGDKICVYGDYDCDGIMASVMIYSYLSEAGADVNFYIPERSDGYGLNKKAIHDIAEQNVKLIITVDNGITAIEEADYIYECGMSLVITDHHQPGNILPHAEAVVDPHRNDCYAPFKPLCGAGVVLKLIAALDGGDYTMALEQFGDLAAIATVADIVSLTGENRFIVSYGMNLIENTDRPALEALKEVCGLSGKEIDSYSIGFGLAPRINAAGRFGSPKIAAELFLCEDLEKAEELAETLDNLNSQRKNAEAKIMHEIYDMIDKNPDIIYERVIFICGKNWHHGVIGIVASKITEQFGKPCFIASEENGEIRGSARSFSGFSVFEALTYCTDALEKFGGHPGAGGFTIKNGMIDDFRNYLYQYALNFHRNMPDYIIKPNSEVLASELTPNNVSGLKLLEPFGCDNEKPLFYLKNALVFDITPIKNNLHCKIRLKCGSIYINAFIFNTPAEELRFSKNDCCDFILNLDIYSAGGKEYVSAVIKDYNKNSNENSSICLASKIFDALMRGEKLSINNYKLLMPLRNETAAIYKRIPENGITFDSLFSKMNHCTINYGKFSTAIEAMRQLKLISYSPSTGKILRLDVHNKVDLMSAPILADLDKIVKQITVL